MVGAVRDWRCVQACCWAVGRLLGLTAHRYAFGTHGEGGRVPRRRDPFGAGDGEVALAMVLSTIWTRRALSGCGETINCVVRDTGFAEARDASPYRGSADERVCQSAQGIVVDDAIGRHLHGVPVDALCVAVCGSCVPKGRKKQPPIRSIPED